MLFIREYSVRACINVTVNFWREEKSTLENYNNDNLRFNDLFSITRKKSLKKIWVKWFEKLKSLWIREQHLSKISVFVHSHAHTHWRFPRFYRQFLLSDANTGSIFLVYTLTAIYVKSYWTRFFLLLPIFFGTWISALAYPAYGRRLRVVWSDIYSTCTFLLNGADLWFDATKSVRISSSTAKFSLVYVVIV